MSTSSKYVNQLEGASVLIIGGSSGIGYGVAEASIEHGMTVAIASSQKAKVSSKVEQLKKAYPDAASRINGHVCDLSKLETLEQNLERLLQEVGRVDHIIYTAGDALTALELGELDVDNITKIGLIRFYGPLMLAKHAASKLSRNPGSSITLTSGALAEKPRPNLTVVSAYAAGLQGMVRGLALDLRPVRVNLVMPGAVETESWSMPEDVKQEMLQARAAASLTGRIGRVEDVAQSYLYLMKDQNITGATINTSSGMLLL